jgi:tetratricopeptide (TPR) repeat protein
MKLVDRSSEETGWLYDHIYSDLIRSYWYEGNFSENARLLEEWIPQLNPTSQLYGLAVQDLGMAYSALDRHADAETVYRKALAAAPQSERWYVADMVIRTLMHRNAYAEARRALDEFRDGMPEARSTTFDAALAELERPGSQEARAACVAALPAAEEQGRSPGPVGSKTSYSSFLLGIVYRGAGKNGQAAEILTLFAEESAANKLEWGVTQRWEIAKARELASMR